MKGMKMGRRGFTALLGQRLVTFLWGIILLALVFLLFAVLLVITVKQYQGKLSASAQDLSTNTSILTYLRSPITLGGEQVVVAEALARAAATGTFEPLHADIRDFLEQLPEPSPVSGWRYRVAVLPEEQIVDELETIDVIGWYEVKRLKFHIPAYDPNEQLEVTFALECDGCG